MNSVNEKRIWEANVDSLCNIVTVPAIIAIPRRADLIVNFSGIVQRTVLKSALILQELACKAKRLVSFERTKAHQC